MGAPVLRGHKGWSKRQVALAAGVGVSTVWNLIRVGLLPEHLEEVDVVLVRVAAELGATRPTNRENKDDRTVALLGRDAAALAVVRRAALTGNVPSDAVLLITTPEATPLLTADPVKQLEAIRVAATAGQTLIALPVGEWLRVTRPAEVAA